MNANNKKLTYVILTCLPAFIAVVCFAFIFISTLNNEKEAYEESKLSNVMVHNSHNLLAEKLMYLATPN